MPARTHSGPPPDPFAARRDKDAADWTRLPAEGRTGDPPAWPLPGRTTAPQRKLWAAEWTRPQAVMWERNRQELLVATYVSAVLVANSYDGKAADRNVVRQLMEELGISDSGLLRHRWVIDGTAEADAVQSSGKARPRADARDRLSLVVNQ
jgi:hypothetical protein